MVQSFKRIETFRYESLREVFLFLTQIQICENQTDSLVPVTSAVPQWFARKTEVIMN